MSYHQKTVAVTCVNFSLILVFFVLRVLQMVTTGTFDNTNVFWLFGTVIVLAVVVTILATILTFIVSGILEAIKTRQEPVIEDVKDERDTLIDLRGTKVTYLVSSIGGAFAMLSFVLGQPPLVMFTALIFAGLVAQVVGDVTRLYLYKRGF